MINYPYTFPAGTTAPAMVHSKDAREEVELVTKVGDNDYLVRTKDGILCHAIFNIFVGIYYADDIYTKVKENLC